jgi:hypothetical protein
MTAFDDNGVFGHVIEFGSQLSQLRFDAFTGLQDGIAHEDGRPAGGRGRVEGNDRGVAHDDCDVLGVYAERLRGDLAKNRARALTHVRRSGQQREAAVVVHPRQRERRGGSG